MTCPAPRYLNRHAVAAALPMGEVALPQRQTLPLAGPGLGALSLVMGASAPGVGAVCKLVSVVPQNPARGLPRTLGVVHLIDAETGELRGILDGTELTALRTGAASGLATQLLAPPKARVAAILGTGGQAQTQLLAIDAVRSLAQIRVFSRCAAKVEAFIEAMAPRVRARLVAVGSPEQAVAGAQIVCTATSSTTPVFPGRALGPEVHVNCVGSFRPSMRELDLETLRDATIVVDSREAAVEEAGELLAAVDAGITSPGAWTELGALLEGATPGQPVHPRPGPKTVFDSVGLAAQDLFAARRALARAAVLDLGVPL